MKIKIFSNYKISEKDINDRVIRVKALMVNSSNDILLVESFGTIQFPGGHLEKGETLVDGLKREVLEETGIALEGNYEPFFAIKHILKDFPVMDNNRSVEVYYFKVNTNEDYHIDEINLDDQERNGDFNLFYVPIKDVKKKLKENIDLNPINKVVTKEMLLALKYWKKR